MRNGHQFKRLSEDWAEELVGSVCDVTHGFAFDGKEFSSDVPEGNPLVITPGNFTEEGKLLFNEKNTKRFNGVPPDGFSFDIGDLVVVMTDLSSKMKILGKPAFVETDDVLHNQRIGRVVFKTDRIEKRLLYYFMLSDQFTSSIKKTATGTMVKHTAPTRILNNLIRFPRNRKAQGRIIGLLDEAFGGIATVKANAERNLQNARALFESHLQSVFTQRGKGWVEKRLDEVGTTQTGSTPKTSERENYGDFIPFVKPADFNTDGSLDYENDGLTKKGLSEARKVAAGSVLMVCIGATIGKCGYTERNITMNQQINALTPFDGVSNKFVYYQMLTEAFQRRMLLSSAQATLPIINKSKWSALTVVLPPKLEEQKRIAAKCESLCEETQRLARLGERRLAALEALKKSLLNKAFSGEL